MLKRYNNSVKREKKKKKKVKPEILALNLFLILQVFESGDVEAIANKLFSMQRSLAMLVNVIDYEDKKLQLEGLKNRLEAIASPKLVQAFTAANMGILH